MEYPEALPPKQILAGFLCRTHSLQPHVSKQGELISILPQVNFFLKGSDGQKPPFRSGPQICNITDSTALIPVKLKRSGRQEVRLGRHGWPENQKAHFGKAGEVHGGVAGVVPAFTLRALARSVSSSSQLLPSPSRMAVHKVMQSCPATPIAASTILFKESFCWHQASPRHGS